MDLEDTFDFVNTDDLENGYDDSAADDTEAVDDSGDDVGFDDGGDDAADDGSDGSGDDDATASAARLIRADDSGDDEDAALLDDSDDSDLATGNECVDGYLDAGVWVHEAELSTDDAGTPLFDAVSLVADGE